MASTVQWVALRRRLVRIAPAALAWLALVLCACASVAQPLPDATQARATVELVGRVVALRGEVWVTPAGASVPQPADNRPLGGGERIQTAAGARALLQLGSTVLRLGPQADLRLRLLDRDQVAIDLVAGSVAIQVASEDWLDRIVLASPEGQWRALQPGHYRIDCWADATRATVWQGELRYDGSEHTLIVASGQSVELSPLAGGGPIQAAWGEPVADEFAEWVLHDARVAAHAAASLPISPEVVGAEQLGAYGDWSSDPDWGSVWVPRGVGPGWTPYGDGRWSWIAPWGWTWIDASVWGFAPFHYGRWIQRHGRWAWAPGSRRAPPGFVPAPPDWTPPHRRIQPPLAPPGGAPPDHRPEHPSPPRLGGPMPPQPPERGEPPGGVTGHERPPHWRGGSPGSGERLAPFPHERDRPPRPGVPQRGHAPRAPDRPAPPDAGSATPSIAPTPPGQVPSPPAARPPRWQSPPGARQPPPHGAATPPRASPAVPPPDAAAAPPAGAAPATAAPQASPGGGPGRTPPWRGSPGQRAP